VQEREEAHQHVLEELRLQELLAYVEELSDYG
jgi:hypothetical protein